MSGLVGEEVRVERRDAVLVITIDRPQARNALTRAVAEAVAAAVDELDADDGLRVGVLTGAGGTFSAGMDLKASHTYSGLPHRRRRGSPSMAERPVRAAIYARISDDKEGREHGVTRQVEDCRALAERLGWTLHPEIDPVFVDNDISASTKSRKRRPAFDRLLAAVGAGEVDGILYYSNSRLTRRPAEYETVIKLVEDTGVRLATVASGSADLTTADGRMIGRILAAQDAAEAERIGERVSRAFQQRRDTHNRPSPVGRSFGFEKGGEIVKPDEAEAIRLAAKLILDGASLNEVARVWMENGTKPIRGEKWFRTTVRYTLMRPRNAGLVSYKGEILGEGSFDAILDRDTWERMCAAISDRSSLSRAQYKGRENLLSGLAYCGVCGHRMIVHVFRGEDGAPLPKSVVQCDKGTGHGCGRVSRNLAALEAYVFAVVDARLADVRPLDPAEGTTAEAQEFARLSAEREAAEARIATLREQYAAGDIDSVDFVPILRSMRNKVTTLDAQLRDFEVTGSPLGAEDVLAAWREGSFEERREILELLIAQIVLHPIGRVGPVRAKQMVPATTEVLFG
ncbi:recombinase family protein [Geodermatophilus sp. DSM 45219]|uniref:recombinase family protein n=1 Tax=Geodermatophilus sp. DSM 45219 TaxID=1881103 RepID=UPI00089253FD|nr:recombinase family protein [Geodermatophilus sp. DSM 45219]SDN79713.1 Site-specific DNA recombinase [Geodermatophilus sp. DSM 45219]